MAAASSTRTPSGITSLPMPSPGMAAMRKQAVVADPLAWTERNPRMLLRFENAPTQRPQR